MKTLIWIVALALASVGLFRALESAKNYYNKSVNLEMSFNKGISKRLTVIDNRDRTLINLLEVAKINDTAYAKTIELCTSVRADGQALTWKWIRETNPNLNYNEVSELYKNLSAAIETYNNQLPAVEAEIQGIVQEYEALKRSFPSNIYLFYRPYLKYEPISTSENKVVNSTGVDNTVNLR